MLWQIGIILGVALALFPALRRRAQRAGWWLFGAFIVAVLAVTARHYWG